MKNFIPPGCLLLLFLLVAGCKDETEVLEIAEFPESVTLKGVPLNIKTTLPFQLMVQDSLLIILNRRGENLFHVYDTETTDLLYEFGNKGRGPGEFHQASFTNQQERLDNQLFHVIYDGVNQRINYVNFTEGLRNEDRIKSIKSPRGHLNADRFVFYSDSLSISTLAEGRFTISDGKTNKVGYLPELPYDIQNENLYLTYNNKSAYINRKESKLVGTTPLLGQYDFFSLSGELLHSTVIDRDLDLKNLLASHPINYDKLKIYHTEIKQYNSMIYALYLEIDPSKEATSLNTKIHVLDWKGNPQKKYILDGFITSFAYDEIQNCFYGIETSRPEYEIVRYDLKI